jgi:hypothetical protein
MQQDPPKKLIVSQLVKKIPRILRKFEVLISLKAPETETSLKRAEKLRFISVT